MKRVYVPFALTDRALLTSIFMIAAHMYIKYHALDPVRQDKYPVMAWKYTHECYQMAHRSVETDNISPSDATISLALVMGCVEVRRSPYVFLPLVIRIEGRMNVRLCVANKALFDSS